MPTNKFMVGKMWTKVQVTYNFVKYNQVISKINNI